MMFNNSTFNENFVFNTEEVPPWEVLCQVAFAELTGFLGQHQRRLPLFEKWKKKK